MKEQNAKTAIIIQNALVAARLAKKVSGPLSLHGLSLSEFLVLGHLDAAANQTVSRIQLADYLGMSASGITRLIAPMEKNRLIEKQSNPRDARQSLVKISTTGQRVYHEATVSFNDFTDHMFMAFSQVQLEKLMEFLDKMNA